ncbi:hypothetical protein BIW11_05711 [Tropilaelaps mercedesae]|uniref:Uncharacterized protein n=1 Tax=Tropilaelaps mercedesae TaxID=418985 RepID=A0A1V9Y163_9ACAR|nr:hypothetical protein BIW11_05711 [Tropilaelaps mercedesae]
MADCSSDSSELRNYLKELRKRTGAGSPSRIPKPAVTAGSLAPENNAEDVNVLNSSLTTGGRGGRAAALLNKVASLGISQHQRQKSQVHEESTSLTSSPTLSTSKREVSFKLDNDSTMKPSKIPRSPQQSKKQNDQPAAVANGLQQKSSPESRSKVSHTKSPDVGRHQIKRSPSPYHKNCQHSLPPASPEPQRTPSPRMKSSSKVRRSPSKSTSSAPTENSTSKKESRLHANKAENEKDSSGKAMNSDTIKGSDHTSKTTTSVSKSSVESTTRKSTEGEKCFADYSDTFEESTSKTKATSSKYTRSKSLDTGLHNRTLSEGTKILISDRPSLGTLKKSKSTSSASSKSTSVPDWWFPAILPPQHFGGEHLEELHKLHAGVLDDLFRFQVGLIEKHQQRADSRHKAVREFVKRKHDYTNWRSYQSDPRVQFVKWHREAGYLEAP